MIALENSTNQTHDYYQMNSFTNLNKNKNNILKLYIQLYILIKKIIISIQIIKI